MHDIQYINRKKIFTIYGTLSGKNKIKWTIYSTLTGKNTFRF